MLTGLETTRVISSVRDATVRPPNTPPQPHPTIDPSTVSDEDMAWSLVEAVKPCLTGYERTVVFVELGCGESYLAIKHILTALLSTPMALPVAILSKLTDWLNGYAGSAEETQLRMMLAVIRLQQSEAV